MAINSSRVSYPMERKPVRVWLVLDKEHLIKFGPQHHRNAFLEDKIHDWDWFGGRFSWYGHSAEPSSECELYIMYAEDDRGR